MHKVLIVSDSHRMKEEVAMIAERHEADLFIHCGDSELKEDDAVLARYVVVKGNCDWYGTFPEDLVIEHGGLRFYVTHGHLYDVKRTLQKLQYRALEVEADIACFGHSHVAYAEQLDGTLFLNPGSIRVPRKFRDPSYVLLEWKRVQEVTVTFYHVDGSEIEPFPYNNTFSF